MKIWGISDVGIARKLNEDTYIIHTWEQENGALVTLCDGMGGANGGEVASAMAAEIFSEEVRSRFQPRLSLCEMKAILNQAAQEANRRIYMRSSAEDRLNGMGTTLVALLSLDGKTAVVNVGDSRAYLIDENEISQITCDHSLVNEMLRRGELTAYQAQHHPSRNVITRALGVEEQVQCDIFEVAAGPGQFVLLCSDGLTGEVSEPEIYYEVYQSGKPEQACQTLVNIANARGGHDNVTIVLVGF